MKKVLIGWIVVMLLMGCTSKKAQEEIYLEFNDISFVEYGSQINTSDFVKQTNGDIAAYPTLDTSVVGEHQLSFDVKLGEKEKSYLYTIEVKDTQKPSIALKKKTIEIEYKGKLNVLDNIKSVKDKVDGNISYKKENDVQKDDFNYYTVYNQVNTSKAGSYSIQVKAVDKNKNMSETSFEVVVKQQKKVAKQESKRNEQKEIPVKEELEKKETKPSTPTQKDYTYVLTSTIEKTKVAKNANKIITVSTTSMSSHKAVVQYFVKKDGQWVEEMKVNGQVGKEGIGIARENSTKTPIGSYRFTHAYGLKDNPGSLLPYTQINEHHYWCGDQYYNQFVDDTMRDHSSCSITNDEHLIDYPQSYNYFAAFNYNASNIPGKGAAFFLHCTHSRYSSTGGCVAVPESHMFNLLREIDASTVLLIDLVNRIETY